ARESERRLWPGPRPARRRQGRCHQPGDASLPASLILRGLADIHRAPRRRDPRHAPSAGGIMSAIDRATALGLYRVMRTIRSFEERATQLFGENKMWGTIHSYAGEEAIA